MTLKLGVAEKQTIVLSKVFANHQDHFKIILIHQTSNMMTKIKFSYNI